VKLASLALGQAVDAGEGGLGAETLPRPPSSSGGVKSFGPFSLFFLEF
jgi:hypothetical protein